MEIEKIEIPVNVGKALKRPDQAKISPQKRKKFLQIFADTFNFSKAARAINVNRVSVYELIAADHVFAEAFQEIKDAYLDTVEETSISIALQPDARSYNDRRLMLEAHRKEVYGKNADVQVNIQVNNIQASGELSNFLHRVPTKDD